MIAGDLSDTIIALLEDIDRDIEQREHSAQLQKLVAVLDRPALGAYRRQRQTADAA